MSEKATPTNEEIFSKVLRAGRRTYFFDVRATKADDFYLTITESKKHESQNGDSYYKKHKVYLYKEDFVRFKDIMNEVMDFIIAEKGEEVISDRHNPDFFKENPNNAENLEYSFTRTEENEPNTSKSYTDISFEEI